MGVKRENPIEFISGWEALQLFLDCVILGSWQFFKIFCKGLWRGQLKNSDKTDAPLPILDSSVGTHYYIKVMGVKYHYVEQGSSSNGELVVILGDAPGLGAAATWGALGALLADTGRRVVSLHLRGTGGSESGSRLQLTPPQAVAELRALLEALGACKREPAVLIGHGLGGMLTWYLAHSSGDLLSKFIVIGAPHPNLYWHHPPAAFCQNALHFIQWPWVPERWLARAALSEDEGTEADSLRWASCRPQDWAPPLNYLRGAAWYRVSEASKCVPGALLVGGRAGAGAGAAQVVASAQYCAAPTLRLLPSTAPSPQLHALLLTFITENDKITYPDEASPKGGMLGRVLGAVAGRGRELSAAVTRARYVLPLSPTPALS